MISVNYYCSMIGTGPARGKHATGAGIKRGLRNQHRPHRHQQHCLSWRGETTAIHAAAAATTTTAASSRTTAAATTNSGTCSSSATTGASSYHSEILGPALCISIHGINRLSITRRTSRRAHQQSCTPRTPMVRRLSTMDPLST